ncbi:hypothetical protein [Pararhodospirillum photometricum]|uniref:Uncharacterized protein n=1 Tax=Pararhodospirillum photometricum DSM 122 TaxID=1150469 RepID=H6SS13_PARPM|nr:hypothetical protein [Pararhodospirillum photometricum]CCG07692.1 Putative uncharacterized protein [Pararhodospirillum photometricum DSM 122]
MGHAIRGVGMVVGLWLGAVTANAAGPQGLTPAETLVFTLPPGWETLYTTDEPSHRRAVFVPEGQGAQDWKDMVVVSMARGEGTPSLQEAHQRTIKEYETTCQAHTTTVPQTKVENNIGRAFWSMGCFRRKDVDAGEASLFLYIQGREGSYMVQRIWRTPPFGNEGPPIASEERDHTVEFLRKIKVCALAPTATACP